MGVGMDWIFWSHEYQSTSHNYIFIMWHCWSFVLLWPSVKYSFLIFCTLIWEHKAVDRFVQCMPVHSQGHIIQWKILIYLAPIYQSCRSLEWKLFMLAVDQLTHWIKVQFFRGGRRWGYTVQIMIIIIVVVITIAQYLTNKEKHTLLYKISQTYKYTYKPKKNFLNKERIKPDNIWVLCCHKNTQGGRLKHSLSVRL